MADNVINGKEGVISLDASDVDVTAFTITETGGTIDVTDGSDAAGGYRAKQPGKFKVWSGTADVLMKVGQVLDELNTSLAFIGTAETTTATITYTGNISITEIVDTIPVEAEEAVKHTINFEGLSTLVKVNTAV